VCNALLRWWWLIEDCHLPSSIIQVQWLVTSDKQIYFFCHFFGLYCPANTSIFIINRRHHYLQVYKREELI
jgi:hypothetical protein